jgi:hypothetical protein
MDAETIVDRLLDLGSHVRYVAVGEGQEVVMRQRDGLAGASSSESDRYEELLVNPTLVELARQRGEIDCGGLDYLVVRYGNFFQVVVPHGAGHVSVAVEPDCDPIATATQVLATLRGGLR